MWQATRRLSASVSESVSVRRLCCEGIDFIVICCVCVAVFQGDCDLQILTLSQTLLVYSRIRGDIHTKNHKPEGIPRYES